MRTTRSKKSKTEGEIGENDQSQTDWTRLPTELWINIFRWLSIRFLEAERHPAAVQGGQLDLPRVELLPDDSTKKSAIVVETKAASSSTGFVQETDAPPCHECGTLMVRNGACHKCPNCGSTSGCS